ncbi:MAG: hypothetical protein ACE5HX_05390 [bacterium]
MKELLYFSSSDLMIQVQYKQEDNSLHYCSHRKLSFGERVIVEQYLLTNIAVKTDYYKKHPAILNYIGINNKLLKELNQFHLKNTIKNLKDSEQDVDNSVKDLIDRSMANYYFEQIGNVILEIRKISEDPLLHHDFNSYKNQLEELIEAYNIYSERKVTYDDVLPKELLSFFNQNIKNVK